MRFEPLICPMTGRVCHQPQRCFLRRSFSRRIRVVFALTLLALSSCATAQWSKPGVSQAEFEIDQAVCSFEASKATGNLDVGFAQGWNEATIINKCLLARGWRR